MRYAFSRVRALPRRAQGRRSSARPARSPTTRSTDQTRELAAATGRSATGWSSPAPAPGSWRRASRAPGAENAFGVSIRLPFEAATTQFLADDPKLMNFRYFFTRKLDVREGVRRVRAAARRLRHARRGVRAAHAACRRARRSPRRSCCSTSPAAPTGSAGASSSTRELASARLHLARATLDLVLHHRRRRRRGRRDHSASTRNYHSQRFVDGRPGAAPADARRRPSALAAAQRGVRRHRGARRDGASSRRRRSEIADDDHVDLARIAFRFDRHGWSRLRMLIDRLNDRPDP